MLHKTETLIVGGGIHGCALGARLIADSQPLLASWMQGIRAQEITVLRTPYTAHIDPDDDPESIRSFERSRIGRSRARTPFAQRSFHYDGGDPLSQPVPADSFNGHALAVVDRYGLEQHRFAGWAIDIRHARGTFLTTIATSRGHEDYVSEAVVVAMGIGKPWMPEGGPTHASVMHSHHVDMQDGAFQASLRGKHICIVGGSLTAGTLALRLIAHGARVSLCTRGSLTVDQLEVNPAWRYGERLHDSFARLTSWDERSRQLTAARVGHGVTPDVWSEMATMIDSKRLTMHENAPVECWEIMPGGKIGLPHLPTEVDGVIFATGYHLDANDVPFLRSLMPELQVTSGMPHVERTFEAAGLPNLYFMGRLAELQGGPLSRNIPGAQFISQEIAEQVSSY